LSNSFAKNALHGIIDMIPTDGSKSQGRQNLMGPNSSKIYIVNGRRTPFGRFGGSLAGLTPVELTTIVAKELLQHLGLKPDSIDQVIFANVIPSTPDTLYGGRHVALKCGMPASTPAYSVNRLCGSGLHAILDAARLIKCQEAKAVLVTGAENLSMAPHLVYGSRFGTKYGALGTKDLLLDTLTDLHIQTPMGITAENLAEEYGIARAAADEFAFNSHQKANQAYAAGFIQPELVSVQAGRVVVDKDEHLRTDISIEELAKLRTSFKKDGTVTPGSASGIVDGAAAMVVASEAFVKEHKLTPLAEIIDGHVVGVDPARMGIGPVPAIKTLLARQGKKIDEIDLFEINEAFAPQAMACGRALGIPEQKLNVWGGAVALGHPLGATGIKITLTLARQLSQLKKEWGMASACIGGGQGIALLVRKA
jgi:acetyl-CoA acyltransferase 2